MPPICIFYDNENFNDVLRLAECVEGVGWKTWLADRDSFSGDWRAEVEKTLRSEECKVVLVCWSEKSIKNDNVRDEAEHAKVLKKIVINIFFDDVKAPYGFGGLQRVQFTKWDGSDSHPKFMFLIDKLNLLIPSTSFAVRGSANIRPNSILIDTKQLLLPSFVFSVSSFETQVMPKPALDTLVQFLPKNILVSAYDVLSMHDVDSDSNPKDEQIKKILKTKSVLFLDSGNYEAHHLNDEVWMNNPWVLSRAVKENNYDFIFCHDKILDVDSKDNFSVEEITSSIISCYNRDLKSFDENNEYNLIPIIHAPRLPDKRYLSEGLPLICRRVSQELSPKIIAIPERELGDGILNRARMVNKIRKALNRLQYYQPVHLLGTGNPISILIFAYAGADVFDGLEWVRTVIDGEKMRLHHFQQYDLFVDQKKLINDERIVEYFNDYEQLYFHGRVIIHNMYFMDVFMKEIVEASQNNNWESLFEKYLPGQFGRINKYIGIEG